MGSTGTNHDGSSSRVQGRLGARGSKEAGQWWHKQWAAQAAAAPAREAAGRVVCRWRLGSTRARLGEAQ